jgi:hypothetical protein
MADPFSNGLVLAVSARITDTSTRAEGTPSIRGRRSGIAPVWIGNREGYIDKRGQYVWNPIS